MLVGEINLDHFFLFPRDNAEHACGVDNVLLPHVTSWQTTVVDLLATADSAGLNTK